MRQALLPLLLAFPSSPVWASTSVSIVSTTGEVKIGHDGEFHAFDPKETMGERDFLLLAPGATLTATIAGSQPVTFTGKATIPCRRLLDPKASADVLTRFSVMMQKAADAIGGAEKKSSSAGATKAGTPTPQVAWAGEERKLTQTSAELDQLVTDGRYELAERLALALVGDPKASSLERRQAHVCLGDSLLANGDLAGARKEYEAAATPLGKDEADAGVLRARALVGRGYVRLESGDDASARQDFEEAIRLAPAGSHPSGEAHLFLGLMAGVGGDREKMAAELNQVGEYDDLQKLAVALRGS